MYFFMIASSFPGYEVVFPLLYSTLLLVSLTFLTYLSVKYVIKKQDSEKKLKNLQAIIQKDSTSGVEYLRLAHVYLSKNLYDKGIISLRQALRYWDYEDQIGLCSLYNTLGFVYFRLKKYEYANYYFKRALTILPDYTLALRNLALTYKKLNMIKQEKKTKEIIAIFEKKKRLNFSQYNVTLQEKVIKLVK